MTEKNQQEKMAAERQVELFTKAFGKAKEDNGIWLGQQRSQGSWTLPEAFAGISLQCHHLRNARRSKRLQNQPIYAFFRKQRNVASLFNQKRKEYHSFGTTGTSMSTSTTLRTKSAVQTTRLSLQTSKQTIKVSEAVK